MDIRGGFVGLGSVTLKGTVTSIGNPFMLAKEDFFGLNYIILPLIRLHGNVS